MTRRRRRRRRRRRVRTEVLQRGPSCNLDEYGDPMPVRYEVWQEVEVEPGVWKPLKKQVQE